jgi:hypothetical protein
MEHEDTVFHLLILGLLCYIVFILDHNFQWVILSAVSSIVAGIMFYDDLLERFMDWRKNRKRKGETPTV